VWSPLFAGTAAAGLFLLPPAPSVAMQVMRQVPGDSARQEEVMSWLLSQPWVSDPAAGPSPRPRAYAGVADGDECFQRVDPAAELLEDIKNNPFDKLNGRPVLREILSRWSAESLRGLAANGSLQSALGDMLGAAPTPELVELIKRLLREGVLKECDVDLVNAMWHRFPWAGETAVLQGATDAAFAKSCLRAAEGGLARQDKLWHLLRRAAWSRHATEEAQRLGVPPDGSYLVVVVPRECATATLEQELADRFGESTSEHFGSVRGPVGHPRVFGSPFVPVTGLQDDATFDRFVRMNEERLEQGQDQAVDFATNRRALDDLAQLSREEWAALVPHAGPPRIARSSDGRTMLVVLDPLSRA